MTIHQDLLLIWNFYVQPTHHGYFLSLEFVRPVLEASLSLSVLVCGPISHAHRRCKRSFSVLPFIQYQRFLHSAYPRSQIYHQWIVCNPYVFSVDSDVQHKQ